MLGGNRWRRKCLQRRGVPPSRAEIIGFKERPWSYRNGTAFALTVYRFTMKVTPAEGDPFIVRFTEEWSLDGDPRLGMKRDVFFDPRWRRIVCFADGVQKPERPRQHGIR